MNTRIFTIALAIALTGVATTAVASTKDTRAMVAQTQIEGKLQQLEDSIKEVRRDQLNYKVEKDLLKEAYASNTQTIQIVITIVLGFIGLFGFVGIRDIGALKKEFKEELEKIRGQRIEIETSQKSIAEAQSNAKEQLARLLEANKVRDERIEVLELQEKAGQLVTSNPIRALEYCAVGLDIKADDTMLLALKALALGKLNRIAEALREYEKLLAIDPNDASVVGNLLEGYLVLEDLQKFDRMYEDKHALVATLHGGATSTFLQSVRAFVAGDVTKLKQIISEFVLPLDDGQGAKMGGWSFAEVNSMLKKKPDTPAKELLTQFVSLLAGNSNKGPLIELLSKG